MDHYGYSFETPLLDQVFSFSSTEGSFSNYSCSQEYRDDTPASSDWDIISSTSGPSTPRNAPGVEPCEDYKLQVPPQQFAEWQHQNSFDGECCNPKDFVVDGTWQQPILGSNDHETCLAALPYASMSASSDTDTDDAGFFTDDGSKLSAYHYSSPLQLVEASLKLEDDSKPRRNRKSCKSSATSASNTYTKRQPCPYDGDCPYTYKREEHLKRHKRSKHIHLCTPEELANMRIEHCPIWLDNPTACKKTKANRHDNMCQHMATHVKGARNKAVDPWYLVFNLTRQYAATREPEEDPVMLARASLRSIWRNALRDRRASQTPRIGNPDLEHMRSLSGYAEYVAEVGSRLATQRANTRIWDLLVGCVGYYCPELLVKDLSLEDTFPETRASTDRVNRRNFSRLRV